MPETVPFGSPLYLVMLALLVFARGSDFLSTWVATPNLVLEANPLAKKLGWKWGIALNVVICLCFALLPSAAIIISTTSVLVAARNFQAAWLMRSMGEHDYRMWYVMRFRQARLPLYLFCLAGQTLLVLAVGVGLVLFSAQTVPLSIGLGVVAYAVAVAFYSLLSLWRARRDSGYSLRKFVDAPADVE